jgi:hypothetical protein
MPKEHLELNRAQVFEHGLRTDGRLRYPLDDLPLAALELEVLFAPLSCKTLSNEQVVPAPRAQSSRT